MCKIFFCSGQLANSPKFAFYPAAVVEKISVEGRSVNLSLLKKHFFRIDLEDNGLVPFEERNKTLNKNSS